MKIYEGHVWSSSVLPHIPEWQVLANLTPFAIPISHPNDEESPNWLEQSQRTSRNAWLYAAKLPIWVNQSITP